MRPFDSDCWLLELDSQGIIMQTLYIMQGPPGGGKSTLAQAISNSVSSAICSTDDFFHTTDGYKFDPAKLNEYHGRNLSHAIKALRLGHSAIIDNTNIHAWQARSYVEYAVANKIPVVFIRVDGRFKSNHGVPQELVDKMRASMENLTVESCLTAVRPEQVATQADC